VVSAADPLRPYRSRYFFFQVAGQLYLRGWVDFIPDPLLLTKSGSAGNRTWTFGSVTNNSDHYTTEAVSVVVTPVQKQTIGTGI
jgi:hypothetical protein